MSPGLCGECRHARKVVSAKGSTFWLCGMHGKVAGWPKYPPIPVQRCPHHEAPLEPDLR